MNVHITRTGEACVKLTKRERDLLAQACNLVRALATNGQDSLADDVLGPLGLLVEKYGAPSVAQETVS
jgi:hypothetical protein